MKLIKGGLVHDAVQRNPYVADILIEQGKISKVAPNIDAPSGCEIVDASGKNVYPGFVDAHSHLGMIESGIGFEGSDVNEMTDVITPHMSAIDGIQPMDPDFREAARAGVTSVCTGPGSANVLGGYFAVIKTVGDRVDDMIVRDRVAMKCAFGENPKRVYREKSNMTRMSTAARLREMLFKAREYDEKKKAAGDDLSKRPGFDMKLEALLPVIHREIPLKAHAHRADDIFTALRIAREFNVKITLEHTTEGHLIATHLAAEKDVCMAVGPTLTHATKFELREKTFETPGILAKAGCKVSIITDSPVIPQHYLPLCAALAMKSGMDEFDALKAITINAAEHAGVPDRIGSIEAGKDADLVIVNGSCFAVESVVEAVLINGNIVD